LIHGRTAVNGEKKQFSETQQLCC